MYGRFTRKYRFVAGENTTDPPASLTYYSVVSRSGFLISFTIPDINYIYIWACDIVNIYLNEKCREKIWTKYGT